MSLYVVGDLQGCFGAFQRLLALISFDPRHDRLWLVGDLVNRGEASLEILRWASRHETSVTAVLGNHDIHLLTVAEGIGRAKPGDTLDAVLAAPDRRELLDWLRRRPLVHREGPVVMVHAGFLPRWTLEESASRSLEVHQILRGSEYAAFLEYVRSKGKTLREKSRAKLYERARESLSVFTRLRYCHADGSPDYRFKGPPDEAPRDLKPWFSLAPARWREDGVRVYFGHWSTLGLHRGEHVVGLDTGIIWGGSLTAIRIDDGSLHQVSARSR